MAEVLQFMKRHIELILFAALSLVVLLWFGGWSFIHQIDSLFYLNPERRLEDVLYFWKAGESLGISMAEFNLIPFYLLQTALVTAISPLLGQWEALVASQAIMYYLTVFLAFTFSNCFFKQFCRQILGYSNINARDRVLILIVTLFYVINPYTISTVYWRYMTWALFWAAFPILCYLFLKFLETSKLRYVVASGVVFITPLAAGFPQVGFVNLFLAYALLFVLWYFKGQGNGLRQVRQVAFFGVLFIALIAWILIPQFLSLTSTSTYTSAPNFYSDQDYLDYSSQYTTLSNILTMVGNYLLYNNVDSFPYSWSDAYLANGIIRAALYVFPILAGLAMWFIGSEKDKGRKKIMITIAASYLVLPLAMKGVSAPFNDLGNLLFELHSTFFRHPYDRFVSLFIILNAFLMLYALRNLAIHIPDRKRFAVFSLVMILLISAIGYPFFTGEIINPLDKVNLSETNYLNLEDAIGSELGENGRVIVFPFSISGEYSYNISGELNRPNSKSLAYDFLPQASVLQFTLSPYDRFALGYIYEVIKNNDSNAFFSFMYHLNVRAILIQKDYSTEYNINPYTAVPAEDAINFVDELIKDKNLDKLYEDDNVALYRLPEVTSSNMVSGLPALLLGSYSEVSTISVEKPIVPLTGIWGYDPEMFKEYSDLLVSDSPDTMEYLINLMSEKLSISPYELGRLSSDGWEKYATMDALYSNSSQIVDSGKTYSDGNLSASWSFDKQSDLQEWTAGPGSLATAVLSSSVRPGTSGLMMTMTNDTTGTSYMEGPEVNVTSNDILWSVNWMKTQNAAGSNITVMGYDSALGEWRALNYTLKGMSGTHDWEEYSFKVLIPEHIEKVKLRIYASSPLHPDEGDAITWFDQLSLYSMMNYTTSPYMQIPIDVPETGRYYLLYEVLVSPSGGEVGIDLAGINSTIATQYSQQKWIWLGQALYLNEGTYTALVKSVEGTNSVRTISLINETNYIEAAQKVGGALAGKNMFISNSASSFLGTNATIITNESGGNNLVFGKNGSAWTTLSIASEGDYKLSLYGSGSFVLTVDGVPLQLITDGGSASVSTTVHLDPGTYNLTINGTTGSILTSLWTYRITDGSSLDKFLDAQGANDVSIKKLSPTHYRIEISSDSPFMYCLAESYDSQWKATIYKDGVAVRTISPVALYGCLNGFWIDEVGSNITLEITYGPQSLLDEGLAISSLALLAIGAVAVIELWYGSGAVGRGVRSMWKSIRRK
ncbi:MAG: hypothetical protein SA339_01120 [Methanomassiliicoccus sp.]|nr:hypothetical protein [Methanomassiliicoccus sp.]